jgi:hypothetical protein
VAQSRSFCKTATARWLTSPDLAQLADHLLSASKGFSTSLVIGMRRLLETLLILAGALAAFWAYVP